MGRLIRRHRNIMKNHPTPQSNDCGEALLERTITFRNSTFGALKSYIRAHNRRTGTMLTNSAAVDTLLRQQLAYALHPRAVSEMLKLSRVPALQALQTVLSDDSEEGPGTAPEGPQRDQSDPVAPSPEPSRITPSSGSRIKLDVGGRRLFVRDSA